MGERQQYGHQQSTGSPTAVLRMLNGNRGSDGIDLKPPLPGQDAEADGGTDHGINKQDDQHWMRQRQPLQRSQQKKGFGQGNTWGQDCRMSRREK